KKKMKYDISLLEYHSLDLLYLLLYYVSSRNIDNTIPSNIIIHTFFKSLVDIKNNIGLIQLILSNSSSFLKSKCICIDIFNILLNNNFIHYSQYLSIHMQYKNMNNLNYLSLDIENNKNNKHIPIHLFHNI